MAELPQHADLDLLSQWVDDLVRAAGGGEVDAEVGRIPVDERRAAARLAVAHEYGFAGWDALSTEVGRRQILDRGDLPGLGSLLAGRPELAVEPLLHWCDHRQGASPLGYVAMLRYDTAGGVWRDVPGTGALAQALVDAGAPVDGEAGDSETPLMTAASYGDAEVARVLVDAGADLHATAAADSGGVPGGNALRHAVVFGMSDVVDVLVAAGATDLVHAAATGDLGGSLHAATPLSERVAALRMAAERGRLKVIDRLLAAATPVDGVDGDGSTALHAAAYSGRPDSVRHLLAGGADPARRDSRFHSTPLGWCQHRRAEVGHAGGHDEVAAILGPLTPADPDRRPAKRRPSTGTGGLAGRHG